MSSHQRTGTLGELLAQRRRRRLVGRDAEVELFAAALADPSPRWSVLHVHGPGGIGKSSLLDRFADLAEDADVHVVRLDPRDLAVSPRAVLDVLRSTIEVPDGDAPIEGPHGRLVLLVDSYERLAPIDEWLRTRLLPRLPATTLTVLAGRSEPTPGWRADPAWRDLLRVVSLRNLTPEHSREYLAGCGVDEALHDHLIGLTHGHPLGLSLVTDVVARGGEVAEDALSPDLVSALVRSFVDVVPDERQRGALGACALARVTTEPLLRDVLHLDDAHPAFEWLRGLSFVGVVPDGILPHDLARDALDADLRWRDPDEYRRVFRAVAAHVHARLRTERGRAQQRAIADLKFLFRHLPSVLAPVDWERWGNHYPDGAQPTDRAAAIDLVAAAEGDPAAAIAARWWDRQPEGFHVVRGDETLRGVLCLLDLSAATEEDLDADPGARAAWDHAHRHTPPRPGEVVTQTRFVVDRETYQGPSPTLNAVPIVTLQRQLATPNLAWDYLTLFEPEPLDDFFALADLHRANDADFEVAGRRYGLFAHDYRQVPVHDLIQLWIERALAQDPVLRTTPATPVHVLSQAEFTDAVRQALRDLGRLDLLGRNPLLGTRLLRDRADPDEPDQATLTSLLDEAVDTLRRHPRDDRLLRAVERTYLQPAPTQEAAAARLGLPFSTYRRHLTQGVERIVGWLWDQEVYGRSVE